MRKTIAILKLTRRISNDIAYAKSVAAAVAGNPWFPEPTVPLAVFEAHLADVTAADAAALTRTMGLAPTRDAKLAIVLADLRALRAYVQTVADANPASARSIIESAGMSVKRARGRGKNYVNASQGPVAGSAILTAERAGDRAAYEWQWSPDRMTWNSLGQVLQSKRRVRGLPERQRLFFRVRVVTKNGRGPWSDVVSLVVR
jgi:hypothetical protein